MNENDYTWFGKALDIDKIYVLSIPQRRELLQKQIDKFGLHHIIQVVEGYTDTSKIVDQVIDNHCFYPIYTDKTTQIAVAMGVAKIMQDIVDNQYTHALVMEDDVYFIEELLEYTVSMLKRDTINANIDTNKPYVLYLQSTKPESYYQNIKQEGFIPYRVRYGEPVYMTNYQMCQLLLKHLYPITSPFDEYKYIIRRQYNSADYILLPYVCRELSKNYRNYGDAITKEYKPSCNVTTRDVFDLVRKSTFHISNKLASILLGRMNPQCRLTNQPTNNRMVYHVSDYVNTMQGYIYGATVSGNPARSDKPCFVISVRGKLSQRRLSEKYRIMLPIADPLTLTSKYFPCQRSETYAYCLIFSTPIQTIPTNSVYLDPNTTTLLDTIKKINQSRYVVTDDVRYLTIGNSYGVQGIYAIIDKIDPIKDDMMMDYYSNITNTKVTPISINKLDTHGKTMPQPQLPIPATVLQRTECIAPVLLRKHTIYQNPLLHVQVY